MRRSETGNVLLRTLIAGALIWVVAALAGVPMAVDLAERAAGWRDRAAEELRQSPGGSKEPAPENDPPAPRRLPSPQGGRPQSTPAGTPAGVVDALDSVVQIVVRRCTQGGAGSGFVVGDGRVMTNAHVVQGALRVRVLTSDGERLDAEVVQFDPGTDVAVLDVDGLRAQPLRSAEPAGIGRAAWVAGHPGGGPLRVVDAEVVATRAYGGADRETHVLETRVRPGNSGGPLLDAQGRVLGVVFAAASEDDSLGFARTWASVADEAREGLRNDRPVGVGNC